MPFQMMHGQHGLAQRECQTVGIGCARQQRAAQARPLRVGDGINVGVISVGFVQRGLGERHKAADVVAAGEFGHDAAVFGVHRHLGVQLVGDETALGVV